MSYFTFTPSEETTLFDMISAGHSWSEIAQSIPARSPWCIKDYARTRGYVITTKGRWPVVPDDDDVVLSSADGTDALLIALQANHRSGTGELFFRPGQARRVSVPFVRSLTSSFAAMTAEGGVE